MFNFSANNGDWLHYSEVTILAKKEAGVAVENSDSGITVDADIDISGELIDFAVGYRLMQRDNLDLYGYVGARYFNLEVTLNIASNVQSLNTKIETGDHFVDPFVGGM